MYLGHSRELAIAIATNHLFMYNRVPYRVCALLLDVLPNAVAVVAAEIFNWIPNRTFLHSVDHSHRALSE